MVAETEIRERDLPGIGRKLTATGATDSVLLAVNQKPVEVKVTPMKGVGQRCEFEMVLKIDLDTKNILE
jgi:hypothetical protein